MNIKITCIVSTDTKRPPEGSIWGSVTKKKKKKKMAGQAVISLQVARGSRDSEKRILSICLLEVHSQLQSRSLTNEEEE